MNDDDDNRNGYYDDDERNAMRNALVAVRNARARVVQSGPPPYAPPQVVIAQPVPPPPPPPPRGFFGDLSVGQLIEMGVLGWAALSPLPAKPVTTGDPRTDNTNMVLYQEALAMQAKRVQQLTTVGVIAGIVLSGKKVG